MIEKSSGEGSMRPVTMLVEQRVNPNPFDQFGNWFAEATRYRVTEPEAMVLSTATADGRPAGRVVLMKHFDYHGYVFFTNYESRKGRHLAVNPWASLTFHWKEMERQVRIEGKVVKTTRQESEAYFNSRPFGSRISAAVSPQSSIIPDRNFLEVMHESLVLDSRETPITRPSYWGGFRLKPVLFEFWQGRENRLHDRIQYSVKHKDWVIERLAP
jgi:pyridoxamine 5'-phosphate oxidase